MKNYERYLKKTTEEYEKKTIMSSFCRMPSDRIIIPFISKIKGKRILDVGLGTGYYTRMLVENNEVTGVDQNPHLCKLPIKVYKGDATEIAKLVKAEKFDIVFSTWMTEYLNPQQLSGFLWQAEKVLKKDGKLMTTIISKYGFGLLYVTAARVLRRVDKYNYTKKQIFEKLRETGFIKIDIINLNSWLKIPWAYMVTAQKTG
jgi:cyclopropane fatty-acyl-phospholipid synthase-like methyltransferase